MAFTAKITGVAAILKKIQQAPQKVAMESEKIINESVEEIARAAKARVPVSSLNKVHLKDTIGYNHYVSGIGASVYASAHYAPYVEFGTGGKVSIPIGYEEYAAQFKGTRKVAGMRSQPYLIPSFEMEIPKLFLRLKTLLNA